MNRIIKFRGKRVSNNQWVYGDIVQRSRTYISTKEKSFYEYEIDPDTVGQFTGIVDKNGKEIYEGDVVDCWSEGKHCKDGIVSWVQNRIFISIKNDKGDVCGIWNLMPDNKGIDNSLSVIGNIFDNPELLKGGEQ